MDTVEEKTMLAMKALEYALEHKLDISKKEDVEKILEEVDPEHKENVDEFMELLKDTDAVMELQEKQRERKDKNLPN